ncbi:MAG TPA: 2-C-methyl-D-erythritol 4-phosphate cytidylyltransferase [Pyrinomonadaceae bacterium]|nr:2-C-methyl-D-erythritol 4-phosphate cytidylyltransferase [Acidobacteriota bacterium]HQZ95417.1 2-C-methyl-D-erythritol 4-phosphate cytidylyltransferase [Pyrinomonadaceae bacterium]
MNTAIIVAAGSGSRFGGEQPKQFVEILGKPLIIHTLEKFQACSAVDEIVLVLSADAIEEFQISNFRSEIGKLKKVIAGGSSRAESVKNGLEAVTAETKIVAVHDGARPLVSVDEITATIVKANEVGAACLVGVVTDTIKTIRGDEISGTLDRDKLRRALTPQTFKVEVLRSAFALGGVSEAATDECYLVEKLGHPIAFVEGSSRNIKITRQEDLIFAKAYLPEPLA